MTRKFEHDIAISYAGEDVEIARDLAEKLEAQGVSVFFAPSQQASLLGQRLEDILTKKYSATSRYVAVLVSEHFPVKDWARFELGVARGEEKQRKEAFVLPLRLADARMVEIPPDKAYLDLRAMDLDDAVAILVEKVRMHRGELLPHKVFAHAYREWKTNGFIPGATKSDMFWRVVTSLDLDVEHCEFLLLCHANDGKLRNRALPQIEPHVLAAAGERLIERAKGPSWELIAIGYVGLADPRRAERHLWRVYRDETASVYDRARAFELFWKCPSLLARDEPKEVLVAETQPWPLRRAAAVNLLWSEFDSDREELMSRGIKDPRQEVRSKIVDGIVRFELEQLAPELMQAYERDRSRKGRAKIKWALRHFNARTDVVEFGRRKRFGKAFFSPPPFLHDWEASRPDWV